MGGIQDRGRTSGALSGADRDLYYGSWCKGCLPDLAEAWKENLKWLKEGTINFLIGQDAAVQGHSPVIILFQLLFDSKAPEKEYQYTDIVIRTKYNMG